MPAFDVNPEAVRARQGRLLAEMERLGIELAIISLAEHVQWLTGPHIWRLVETAAAIWADGRVLLVAPPKRGEGAVADEIARYDAQLLSTLRNDQREACSRALVEAVRTRPLPKRIGVEFASFDQYAANALPGEYIDLTPTLFRLRRKKSPDELACLRHAIAATGAMYERARQIVVPGANELDVFNELQSVAVRHLGERLTDTGNDYACRARGGPPRDRRIEAGELYILDLGPAFRGYYSDNCRTIAVGGEPSDVQLRAWRRVADVFPIIERMSKPGASCKAVFDEVHRWINGFGDEAKFDHHLGHGIGLYPHEAPHLNPNWDDVFEVGDVFTAEPGLYGDALATGLRLENDYVVTETGVELLSDFPLEL